MLQQEPLEKPTKTLVRIPQIKRYSKPIYFFTSNPSDSFSFSFQDPFEYLRNENLDIKPQLELKPDRSDFTRVFSNQSENLTNQQISISMAQRPNKAQIYQKQLKKLVQSLENQESLGLKDKKDFLFNTKNILRNICNAQNQFIMFHHSAATIIESYLQNPQKFKKWVNSLRFHTFQEYQKVWNLQKRGVYYKIYRKLCLKFYTENAIPYLMNSRIKNEKTKQSHIRYLHRFLQGLQNPAQFFYFKKKDKEKQF